MSEKFVQDIQEMHEKFGVNEWFLNADMEQRKRFLGFRMGMLREEFNETCDGYIHAEPEEVVDGLIDLIVIAIGTLDVMEVDVVEAWDEVLRANMSKQSGIKPERPNPLGLPDMIKPDGWEGPFHLDNLGFIDELTREDD